jgi:hypothetical protein
MSIEAMKLALEVPLVEQLESVPADARLVIDDADDMGTRYIPVGRMCHDAAKTLRTAIEKLEDAEFHSAEYWKGHDDAVRGVAKRWEEALTDKIPKAGVMNEPLESLYRRTEALRTAISEAESRSIEQAEFEAVHEALEREAGIHISQQPAPVQDIGVEQDELTKDTVARVSALDHPVWGKDTVRTSVVLQKFSDGSFETMNTVYRPLQKEDKDEQAD